MRLAPGSTSARDPDLAVPELAAAIGDQLVLRYEPLVSVRDDEIVGVEARLAWQHPRHGLLDGARFLPLAEATGLSVPIRRWALTAGLRHGHRDLDGVADGLSQGVTGQGLRSWRGDRAVRRRDCRAARRRSRAPVPEGPTLHAVHATGGGVLLRSAAPCQPVTT